MIWNQLFFKGEQSLCYVGNFELDATQQMILLKKKEISKLGNIIKKHVIQYVTRTNNKY